MTIMVDLFPKLVIAWKYRIIAVAMDFVWKKTQHQNWLLYIYIGTLSEAKNWRNSILCMFRWRAQIIFDAFSKSKKKQNHSYFTREVHFSLSTFGYVYVKNKINIWNVSKIIICGGFVFFFLYLHFYCSIRNLNSCSMPMSFVTCVSVARFIPIFRWWLCSFHAKYWFTEPEYIEIFSIDAMLIFQTNSRYSVKFHYNLSHIDTNQIKYYLTIKQSFISKLFSHIFKFTLFRVYMISMSQTYSHSHAHTHIHIHTVQIWYANCWW